MEVLEDAAKDDADKQSVIPIKMEARGLWDTLDIPKDEQISQLKEYVNLATAEKVDDRVCQIYEEYLQDLMTR